MRFHVAVCLTLLLGCAPKKKDTRPPLDTSDNLKRTYFKNGKVNTEISYKNGEKDGVARTYYINGNVNQEIYYKRGRRDGLAKRFYENGKLYQETQYVDDEMEGFRKKYDEDGKLLSEENYRNDFPCKGLKEYNSDGSLRSYPKLNIQPVDRIRQEGKFYLNLSMSDKTKRVKYYQGKLTSDGCVSSVLEPVLLIENKGIGQITYYMPPGSFKMEEVHVVAVVQTVFGSSYVTEASYNLSIDN